MDSSFCLPFWKLFPVATFVKVNLSPILNKPSMFIVFVSLPVPEDREPVLSAREDPVIVLVLLAVITISVSPNSFPSSSCAIALIPGVLLKFLIFLSNWEIFKPPPSKTL